MVLHHIRELARVLDNLKLGEECRLAGDPLLRSGPKTIGSALRLVLTWPPLSMLLNHSTTALLGKRQDQLYYESGTD